ncbi:hypothetical protein DXG01_014995 [Tephrocybe rancida]|nr:hypothetical protein DXG01_014995 [Tephrocybe rancida]
MPPTAQPVNLTAKPMRHPTYYFDDGVVVFQVQTTLFKVHRYFFTRESEVFAGMFMVPPTADGPEGTTDTRPILLPISSRTRRRGFLSDWLSGTRLLTSESGPLRGWLDLLSITDRYQFSNARAAAISAIDHIGGLNPIERLRLSKKYNISAWRSSAFEALCQRNTAISIAEAHAIGLENLALLALARENVRTQHFQSQLGASQPQPAKSSLSQSLTIQAQPVPIFSFQRHATQPQPPTSGTMSFSRLVDKTQTSSAAPYNVDMVKSVVCEVFKVSVSEVSSSNSPL